MSSQHKNLSNFEGSKIKSAVAYKFGIVWSEWNHEITHALYKGAYDTLIKHGAKSENIISKTVPGSFELTFSAHIWLRIRILMRLLH